MWNIAVETSTWNPHDNQKSERLAQFNTQIPNQRIKVQEETGKNWGKTCKPIYALLNILQ